MDSSQKSLARLLVVTGSLNRGGAERHLLLVLPRLARIGFDVEVFCLSSRGELAAEMEAQGVRVPDLRVLPASLNYRVVKLLVRIIDLFFYLLQRRPNIVHFFLPAAYMLGGPVAILTRCRIRLMSRRSQNNYQKRYVVWLGMFEHLLHRFMSAILGNSKSVVRQLAEEGVPEARLHLIYNGVDLSTFSVPMERDVARSRLDLQRDALVFVIVANLIPYKGHADLLRALGAIKDRLPANWRLLCAGRDDGIGPRLQDMATELGIDQNIRWLGSVKDVSSLLAAADVALLTSHEEGFSNSIIEYMATGLPVIATDVGGNAEAVIDGQTGLVVPSMNPAKLGEAILTLASDAALRERFGNAGRQRASEHYSLDACVDNYAALYRELLVQHDML